MNRKSARHRLAPWFVCAIALVATQVARADPVGFGPDQINQPQKFNMPALLGTTYTIGAEAAPENVTASPASANWLKTLPLPIGGIAFGLGFTLEEWVHVGQPGKPGPNWTDWHEIITTPGWAWKEGSLEALGAPAPFVTISGVGNVIDFSGFDLPPSTTVHIVKKIICVNTKGCQGSAAGGNTAFITVREYPTVPEPATLLLLGGGLLALASRGLPRRRRCAAVRMAMQ